jgi:hypothetical protein
MIARDVFNLLGNISQSEQYIFFHSDCCLLWGTEKVNLPQAHANREFAD